MQPSTPRIIISPQEVTSWARILAVAPYSRSIYLNQVQLYLATYDNEVDPTSLRYFLAQAISGERGGGRNYVRKTALKSFIRHLGVINKLDWDEYKEVFEGTSRVKYGVLDREAMETLSYPQALKLVQEIKNPELRLILMIIFDTGARVRAVLRVSKGDIMTDDEGKVYLTLKEKGNTSITRRLTPETYAVLKTYIDKSPFNFIFINRNSLDYKDALVDLNHLYYEYWYLLRKESTEILKSPVSFHWLRRMVGNHIYLVSGKNIMVVKEMLGHKSVNVTQKYLKVQGTQLDKIMDNEHRPW